MKINFSAVLTDLTGKPLMASEDTEWTVGVVVAEALLAQQDQLTAALVSTRYELALRVCKGGEHEITASEAGIIQELVAKHCAPIAAGQIIALTNGE